MTKSIGNIPISQGSGDYVAAHAKDEAKSSTDATVVTKKIQRIAKEEADAGEEREWNHQVVREKYLMYHYNAFTVGASVGVQGKRILGRVVINSPGSEGTKVKIYNNYYQVQAGDLKADIDGTVVGEKNYGGILTNGCFLVISGTGTPPDVTILLA